MKYVYIAGLEHSGTTLTDSILSQLPSAVGLGEVASYFDVSHMQQYWQKYRDNDDVQLCSCLAQWGDCAFWSGLSHLNGLKSSTPISDKYSQLLQHAQRQYGPDCTVIDSSKTLNTLNIIQECTASDDARQASVLVVLAVKDPREFAMSIARKTQNFSLRAVLASFNWWVSANRSFLDGLERSRLPYFVSPYRQLCHDPNVLISAVKKFMAVGENANKGVSHIAMGNKNFTMRNHDKIEYDGEWQSCSNIRLAHLLHFPSRLLMRKLDQIHEQKFREIRVNNQSEG